MAKTTTPTAPLKAKCYTIDEFCESHRVSRRCFYRMREEGIAPLEFKVGERWLITKEAAARWRKARDDKAEAERK